MNTDSLLESVDELFTLLHDRQIQYVLVGGIAMLQYVEGGNTEDIHLIVSLASLQKLPEIGISSQDEHFAHGTFGGLKIDFLLTDDPLFDRVQRRYATVRPFRERDIPCATVEGLLLLKLYALPALYREGSFTRVGLYENDVAVPMHDYQPELASLFEELSRHLLSSDIASLREITAEIQQRIDRFRQRSGDSD